MLSMKVLSTSISWGEVQVTQARLTLCNPMDYAVHGILQVKILEWIPFPSRDLPNPGLEPRSPDFPSKRLPLGPNHNGACESRTQ